ncbi:MAG TPA: hypothetical protein DCX06_04250 [Opitutae bacterium]|nr:hypothetical protein [Opitutae bacterium]
MKKLSLLIAATTASILHADQGYFNNAYVVLDKGSGDQFHQIVTGTTPGANAGGGVNLDTSSDLGNPDFTALGSFSTVTDTFNLAGFEVTTFSNGSDEAFDAELYYRVFKDGETPGAYTSAFVDTTQEDLGSDNEKWQVTGGTIDLLSGITTTGNYNLEIYIENGSNTTGAFYAFGTNPIGTFTISAVPEPSSFALLAGIAAFGYIAIRKRR